MTEHYAFFLGGHDLEMVTIAALLRRLQREGDARIADVQDAGLSWGAKASDYGDRIQLAANAGLRPVLIELVADVPLPPGTVEVDHHGARSAEPSALRQLFDLLALPPDRWSRVLDLVAANDVGHIAGLRRMGATDDEILRIRADDRAAQGITPEEEAVGRAALGARIEALEGSLLVVGLPHARTATVADPLAMAGDMRDLLILTPNSTQFFGAGDRIARLDTAFPGGWRGGELPRRGFWGIARRTESPEVISVLKG